MDKHLLRGYADAILSAASFGLIPLFAMPVLREGISVPAMLSYRYAFAALIMGAVLWAKGISLRITCREALALLLLAGMYAASGISLVEGYKYLPSGVATTLLFTYPLWTALLSVMFFHQKLSARTLLSIVPALAGVYLLSGAGGAGSFSSLKGLLLELFSGWIYSVYMVTLPTLKVSRMPAYKITFYIFLFTMVLLAAFTGIGQGNLPPVSSPRLLVSLALLGLIPTAVSNITLVTALKQIKGTEVAVLGAFEPLTAMVVGVTVLGEPLTRMSLLGVGLIITSVMILVVRRGHHNNKKPIHLRIMNRKHRK